MKRCLVILPLVVLLAIPAVVQASARVKVPTDVLIGPQVKPYVINITGDGSAFFGGYTGQRVVSGHTGAGVLKLSRLGRLTWTSYSDTGGNAYGVEWSKFGPQATADEALRIDGKVSIHVYRPVNGLFTRMRATVTYNRYGYRPDRTQTFTFQTHRGLWA